MSSTESRNSTTIDEMRDWCLVIVAFMKGLNTSSELLAKTEDIIDAAHSRGDGRALKTLSRDIGEWATAMTLSNQRDLNELLLSQFGRGLVDNVQTSSEEVGKILERGKIEGESEYRLLMAHVDEIYSDETKRNELDRVNALLSQFEDF